MKRNLILIFIFLCASKISAQKIDKKEITVNFEMPMASISLNKFETKSDTVSIIYNSRYFFFKFEGKERETASVIERNKNGNIVAKYSFKKGKDLLKRYIYIELINDWKFDYDIMEIEYYYEYIPDKDWIFYDSDGNVKQKVNYNYKLRH